MIHRGKFQTGLQSFITHPDGGVGIVDVCVSRGGCVENFQFDFGHELVPYNPATPLSGLILNEVWYRLNCSCGLFRTAPTCLLLTSSEIHSVRIQMLKRCPMFNLSQERMKCYWKAALFVLARKGKVLGGIGTPSWYNHYKNCAESVGYTDAVQQLSPHEMHRWDACITNSGLKPWLDAFNCSTMLENPKAYLEVQPYAMRFSKYLHHLSYCRYGCRHQKHTTFWIKWADPTHLWAPKFGCKGLGHTHVSMQDEVKELHRCNRVPLALCKELLQNMLRVSNHTQSPWVLSLFEGVGSFAATQTAFPNVKYVMVSHNFSPQATRGPNVYHVDIELDACTSLEKLLKAVWHSTGLEPQGLVGITASPPCTTTTKMDASPNNQHRDHSNGHVAQSQLAHRHDALFLNFFRMLFCCTGCECFSNG